MSAEKRRRNRAHAAHTEEIRPLNQEQHRIIEWLKKVRFKKQIFGGVSERDVWKKIEKLDAMYNQALIAERARYDALLEEQRAKYGAVGGAEETDWGEGEKLSPEK